MDFQLIELFLEYSSALLTTDLYHQLPYFFFNKDLAVPSPPFVSYILDRILLPKQQNRAVMKATVRRI